ncbi:MAG TPA: zinc ribbon domain-containing protein [Oscillospiraceae bacterium]|nr:zinc ribbon domain-containing protein [Oscillospiraceae bacterium]
MLDDLYSSLDTFIGATVFGVIAAIALTVVICIFSFRHKGSNSKFWSFIRRLVNFDFFIIDKIMKVIYIFYTCFCIAYGFGLLFVFQDNWYGNRTWMGGMGLLLIILGPIVVRLLFEFFMLLLTLVNKVISIDSKIKTPSNDVPAVNDPTPPVHVPNKYCMNCGKEINADVSICPWCGTQN